MENQETIEKILSVLNDYQWMYMFSIKDIFMNDLMVQSVPECWMQFVDDPIRFDERMIYFCEMYDREAEVDGRMGVCVEECYPEVWAFLMKLLEIVPGNEYEKGVGLVLDGVFKKGMKAKKIHEVEQLAGLLARAKEEHQITTVVDIGSGKGWIGQVLRYDLNMNVINIEGNPTHVDEAIKRENVLHEHFSEDHEHGKTGTFQEFINFDTDIQYFDSKYMDVCSDSNIENAGGNVALLGLHSCGDLSCFILDLFTKWERCNYVVSVGCCYHKLSHCESKHLMNENTFSKVINEKIEGTHKVTFPLSKYLKDRFEEYNIDNDRIVRLLDLATKTGSFINGDISKLETAARYSFYRSAFSSVLNDILGNIEYYTSKMKGPSHVSSPEAYINKALSGLTIFINDNWVKANNHYDHFDQLSTIFTQKFTLFCHQRQHQLNIVKLITVLEFSLSPIAETLITLDRTLYLTESSPTITATTLPLFSSTISPRNQAIIATKP